MPFVVVVVVIECYTCMANKNYCTEAKMSFCTEACRDALLYSAYVAVAGKWTPW